MTDYRNRIKALEYVNAGDLTAHPGNWRDHPKAQADALKGVLAEVGIAGALDALLSSVQSGDAAVTAMLAELAVNAGIVPPDVDWKEYDESAADDVEYLECPECGHKWPK